MSYHCDTKSTTPLASQDCTPCVRDSRARLSHLGAGREDRMRVEPDHVELDADQQQVRLCSRRPHFRFMLLLRALKGLVVKC